MPSFLVISVRFLDPVPTFHGRADQGKPEWPPSPLRLFQSLVAAASQRWKGIEFEQKARPGLLWLERQIPLIQTPKIQRVRIPYRLYVPNNVGDLVASSWARGNSDASLGDYRVEKDVRPTRMEGDTVRFLFPVDESPIPDLANLQSMVRSVTHLGWGIDMVCGDAEIFTDPGIPHWKGETWKLTPDGLGESLRVPQAGTLEDLLSKHKAFLNRLEGGDFQPVPPLRQFGVRNFQRLTGQFIQPYVAFSLQKIDGSGFRPFDPIRFSARVASMLRHTLANAARNSGWEESRINTLIHGHTPDGTQPGLSSPENPRLGFLSLPTMEYRNQGSPHVGMIRRVIVADPFGTGGEIIQWVRQALSGQELIDEETLEPVAVLIPLSKSDQRVGPFVKPSTVWVSATPVVLPGEYDGSMKKCEKLIRKAMLQAGVSRELVDNADIDFRPVGWLPGIELAQRYRAPSKLKQPKVHLRIEWKNAQGEPLLITGPIALGAGRFRGMGVMVALPD